MFFLYGQINYGVSFAWSHVRRLYLEKEIADKPSTWDQFKGIHGFLTMNGSIAGILIGGQVFVGSPVTEGISIFRPHFYGGARLIAGYNFWDVLHLYGGIGFEAERITDLKKQAKEALNALEERKPDWFKNIVISGDVDFYPSRSLGFGVQFSGRFPDFQSAHKTKTFGAIRVMAKVIFRHL